MIDGQTSRRTPLLRLVGLMAAALAVATGCSDRPGGSPSLGPAAELSEEIRGGNGPFIGSAVRARMEEVGYIDRECVPSETATS